MVCPARTVSSEKYEMMRLEAVCVGYAVPRRSFDAEVHSAFTSAVNLRLVRGSRLLTLIAVEAADLPQGIRLNTLQGFSFEGLRTGEGATCRGGLLRFEHASLAVDLCMARRWKCDLPALDADMTNPATAAAWQTGWQALNTWQTRTGAEIIAEALLHPYTTRPSATAQKISELTRDLVSATRRNDSRANTTIAGLVGIGSGLTPSGDDLLVGYLAGLWCTARGRKERVEFLSGLGRAVVRLSRRTNDISRTYLYHAARGQVSSRLAILARAISRGERSDRLLEVAEAAMQVGHASGMEAVTGLLLGLSAWDGGLAQEKSTIHRLLQGGSPSSRN
jgi:hypothetical protein